MNRHDATDATRNANFVEPDLRTDGLARSVLDAAFEVHRVLGPGFLEGVYEEALAVELRLRSVAFERQVPVAVAYEGEQIGQARLDLLTGGTLIVELKAVEALAPIHVAQALSYLKATRRRLALLITFNVRELHRGVRRVVRSSLAQ